jgi:hypothetical protein
MTPETQEPIKIFYSYAHEDEELCNELNKHLSIFQRRGLITSWYNRDIYAGIGWTQEAHTHLQAAQIILLLISPDFIYSDYCYGKEMMQAIERHKTGHARVIPIILRPVYWEGAPFGEFQVLPTDAKPVTSWKILDEAFNNVARGIRRVLEELNASSAQEHANLPATLPVLEIEQIAKDQSKNFFRHNSSIQDNQEKIPSTENLYGHRKVPGRVRFDLSRELTTDKLFPNRLFLQYINPEILSLYGVARRFNHQKLYKSILRLTKFALLLSEDILIMPASYLFEVGFISQFLKELSPLEKAGILQFASPSADLYDYANAKRVEYRDEPILFPEYAKDDSALISKGQSLSWIPRIQRSTAKDISIVWRQELYKDNGLWNKILEDQTQKQSFLPSKLETAIERIPDRLANKAFIFRYTEPLLPLLLDTQEKTQINMLICRTYLESYLEEFNAMILVDTPIGRLDCNLPQINTSGVLRTISFRALSASLKMTYLLDYIDNYLSWYELIELREQPAFRWLMDLIVINMLDPSHPLSTAMLKSRYRPERSNDAFGKRPLQNASDHILRLFEAIEPLIGAKVD